MKLLTFVYAPLFDQTAAAVYRTPPERDAYMAVAQNELLANPKRGPVIRGLGGARKLRVARPGRGKSGGARAIYVHVEAKDRIHFLLLYPKSEVDDLPPHYERLIRQVIEGIKREP